MLKVYIHSYISTVIPYTTLFRSRAGGAALAPPRAGSLAGQRAGRDPIGKDPGHHQRAAAGRGRDRFDPDRVFRPARDRKSTRLNSSHANTSYAVLLLKKKNVLTI